MKQPLRLSRLALARLSPRWPGLSRSGLALLALPLLVRSVLACGEEFDPPSEVRTLRVLGVQKDHPYGSPGQDVELRLLWHDGSPEAPREIQRVWMASCYNPPGDVFYRCGESLGATAEALFRDGSSPEFDNLPEGAAVGVGDTFTFTIPEDIIRPSVRPGNPPYGVAFVWFAVCAGTLGPAEDGATIPLACYDADGDSLDIQDFVVGYTTVYAFDGISNRNPSLGGLSLAGESYPPDCVDEGCIGLEVPAAEALDCENSPCVPACADDGGEDCPEYRIRPDVDRAGVETDVIATAQGEPLREQYWVDYYVAAGSVSEDARLVNDPQDGWMDDFNVGYRAPRRPGAYPIWVVVHDNRGGVGWVRQTILVQ